jgi:hypothetical protein
MSESENTTPDLTEGQRLMSVKFNPGKSPDVDRIKELMAEVADIVATARDSHESDLKGPDHLSQVIFDNASSQLLNAQMAAVKAVTWGK